MSHHTNDLISSFPIDKYLAMREAAISDFVAAMLQVQKSLSSIRSIVPGIYTSELKELIPHMTSSHQVSADTIRNAASKVIDIKLWKKLIDDTGIRTIMSAKQIDTLESTLYGDNMPEANYDNICATFKHLYETRSETYERGIIDIFQSLSWDYKTNNPCLIGKKIIVNNVLDTRHYLTFNYKAKDKLNDLLRPFYLFDKITVPDHRVSFGQILHDHFDANGCDVPFENEYVKVRLYMKGSAHITFKRLDVVDEMNSLIAKRYPSALHKSN